MNNFGRYYFIETGLYDYEDWLNLRVWHKTKTGKKNKVFIKSLLPKEQEKYRHLLKQDAIKKFDNQNGKKAEKRTGDEERFEEKELLQFYYGVKNPENYNKIIEGKLKIATDEPEMARQKFEEEEGKTVITVKNVPLDAVVQFMDENGEWKKFQEDMPKNDKFDFITSNENHMFLLRLYPYMDYITIVPPMKEDKGE